MVTVSTAELKTHLGRYLRMVRNGESIDVTSHRHSIARLVPCSPHSQPEVIQPTRPMKDLETLTAVQLRRPVDGVGVLLEDRTRR
jgi:antitoxin (DNA-binding transcriptional repressor) of toxin-antitoxin stability system